MNATSLDMRHMINGRKVYRRHHKKRDGRDLYLYGYKEHKLPVLSESNGDIAKGGELRFHPLRDEWNIYAAHRQNRTFKPMIAKGRCDVVVYGPEACGNLNTIGQAKRRLLVAAWNDRYESLFKAGNKFVMPFENRGDEVGVTLHHPHGQIYAFPFIPKVQARAVTGFKNGFKLDAMIRDDDSPQIRKAGPWGFNETELDAFAHLLGDITRRYDEFFQRPTAYMLSLQAAPRGAEDTYHFTTQFYPLLRAPDRVKYLASVEQSTGVFTVDVMPEHAAQTLRAI